VLLACKSTDRTGAVPQRAVQIEEDCRRGHASDRTRII
jgi:hypothetical protein